MSSSRQNTAMFIGGIPLILIGSFMQTCVGSAGLLFNDSSSGHADEVRARARTIHRLRHVLSCFLCKAANILLQFIPPLPCARF